MDEEVHQPTISSGNPATDQILEKIWRKTTKEFDAIEPPAGKSQYDSRVECSLL